MGSKLLRLEICAALLVAVGMLAGDFGVVSARQHSSAVHIRGTAYEFNNVGTLLSGATIRVAEFPRLRAMVGRDGRYDLRVPDHAKVTPYIVDPGYHTIYLQTFRTNGENLVNVNFQTPTDAVYRGLVALLKVPVDSRGNLVGCAIVSTFSTRNVRGLSFAHFIAYGAHGVAGATAGAFPSLPRPVYFNEHVLPDPAQTASSKDGGVVWTNVPSGVYTITAHDPRTRFARFVATCRPGRVVNANPPWGLYQFGLPSPARVLSRWSVSGSQTRVTSLRVKRLPVGAIIRLRCAGRACPFDVRTFRPRSAAFDVRRMIGPGKLRLKPGDELQVAISAQGYNGLVARWTAASGRTPIRTSLCVPLGYVKPRRNCPAS